MIEIKKDDSSKYNSAYLLIIDGELLKNTRVYVHPREQDYCEITAKKSEQSRMIANYRLTDFPRTVNQMNLWYYPTDLEHLNNRRGVFINHVWENSSPTNKYTAFVEFGGETLSEWTSPYTFARYAIEMYKLLKKADKIVDVCLNDIQHSWLDRITDTSGDEPRRIPISLDQIKEEDIHSLSVECLYSSPDVKIADELDRILNILQEVNEEVVNNLTLQTRKSPIEVREVEGSNPTTYQVFINNVPIKETLINKKGIFGGEDIHSLLLLSSEDFDYIAPYRFSDLPSLIKNIYLQDARWCHTKHNGVRIENIAIKAPSSSFIEDINNYQRHYKDSYSFEITLDLDMDHWKNPYSPSDYFDEILNLIESRDDYNLLENSDDVDSIFVAGIKKFLILEYRVYSPNSIIFEEVARCVNATKKILYAAEKNLTLNNRKSIVRAFIFPEEVAVACEQYLQYFIQFLRDLGVEATSELQHKAGEVLFTVTPTDERDALDKIQAALSIYLDLPFSPVSNTGNEIAVLRLESIVHRLQGDLKLAEAEKKAKDIAIEGQRLIIQVQKSLLDGEIIGRQVKDITPTVDDKENVLGGIVGLTKIGKGIEWNLAETYRKLKALFKKEN